MAFSSYFQKLFGGEFSRDLTAELTEKLVAEPRLSEAEVVAVLEQLHCLSLVSESRKKICREKGALSTLVSYLADERPGVVKWALRSGCMKLHTRHNCGLYWLIHWGLSEDNEKQNGDGTVRQNIEQEKRETAALGALLNASINPSLRSAIESMAGLRRLMTLLVTNALHKRRLGAALIWNMVKSNNIMLKLQVSQFVTKEELTIKLNKILRNDFAAFNLNAAEVEDALQMKVKVCFSWGQNLSLFLSAHLASEFVASLQLTQYHSQTKQPLGGGGSRGIGARPSSLLPSVVSPSTTLGVSAGTEYNQFCAACCPGGKVHISEQAFAVLSLVQKAPEALTSSEAEETLADLPVLASEGTSKGQRSDGEGIASLCKRGKGRRTMHCLMNSMNECVAVGVPLYSVEAVRGMPLSFSSTASVFELTAVLVRAEVSTKNFSTSHLSGLPVPSRGPFASQGQGELWKSVQEEVGKKSSLERSGEDVSPNPSSVRTPDDPPSVYEPSWVIDDVGGLNKDVDWRQVYPGDVVLWVDKYAPAVRPMKTLLEKSFDKLQDAFIYQFTTSHINSSVPGELYGFGARPGTDLVPIWGLLHPTRHRCLKDLKEAQKFHCRHTTRAVQRMSVGGKNGPRRTSMEAAKRKELRTKRLDSLNGPKPNFS